MIWSMIEMSIKCPECDAPVHIDGPYRKVFCNTCQSDIDFPEEVWGDLLGDVIEEVPGFKEGEGTNSNIFGHFNMGMTYGKLTPYCINCKRDYKIEEDFNGSDKVICPDCKTEAPAFTVPEWFGNILTRTKMIVGAWPEGVVSDENQPVSEPVAYNCPQCAGSLMIDGTERLIKCDYCETRVYLPDDLWLSLHPVKKKSRWFIGFT
jgi:DNA-directed RNA polymerase subunit RPC12/RpoP